VWFVCDKYGIAVGCIEYRVPDLYVVALLELPPFSTRTLEWACGYIHGYCRELPDRKEHTAERSIKRMVPGKRLMAKRGQANGHDHTQLA